MSGDVLDLFRSVLALLAAADDELLATVYEAVGDPLEASLLEARADTDDEWAAFLAEHEELDDLGDAA